MRVSAIRNVNIDKAKKLTKLNFLGAEKTNIPVEKKAKDTSYVPRMLVTIGIGLAILWATARLFKDKTAPISYLWK